MRPHALYLHGFGSGPLTAKGVALGRNLGDAVASYAIPDLEGGDFFNLTMDGICQRALDAINALPDDGAPVLLAGSSLGGYTAALLAGTNRLPNRVKAILLLAPAFGFTTRWSQILGAEGEAAWRRDGRRCFFHTARNREEWLSSAFLDSCQELPEIPPPSAIPTVVIHGYRDETVNWRMSQAYVELACKTHLPIELHFINGDHSLTNVQNEWFITQCAHGLNQQMLT